MFLPLRLKFHNLLKSFLEKKSYILYLVQLKYSFRQNGLQKTEMETREKNLLAYLTETDYYSTLSVYLTY